VGDWQAEAAFAEFQTRKQAIADVSNRDNEAVTRLRAIDTLLFDVLRWDKSYVETEKYCRAEGYADYVFEIDGRPLLVLEAKRAGTSFVIANASFEGHPYVFQLLAKESPSAMDALRQALGYAATLGSTYIAISNGHQWLFTLTFVPEESLQERHIYVFESLEAIEKRFRLFWNCFSADGIQRNIVSDHLLQSRRVPAPAKFSTRIAGYPHKADRNVFRNELSYILDLVWQIVAQGEASQDFVTNCYVSPNSHADVIGLARELLERRRHEDDVLVQFDIKSIDQLPHQVAQLPAERPFVVLGEVGRGKSSFLKYLRLVAARDSLKNYIQIDIDFLDRPDSAEEVPDFIYGEIERQLREKYHVDIYEDGFVRGVLHGELTRLRKTPKGKLYEGDEKRYREFEVDHIDSVVKNRHSYFTMVMHHLKRGRRCSLAIFFDNLDRRVEPLQEAAFLKCSAMARDWCSLVFVCLRPTTSYKSQQSGVLDAIAPKTFTVSQPDLALVLKKRFTYAKELLPWERRVP